MSFGLRRTLRALDPGRNIKKAVKTGERNLKRFDKQVIRPIANVINPKMPQLPTAEDIAKLIPGTDMPLSVSDTEARKLSILQRIAKNKKLRGASLFGNLG